MRNKEKILTLLLILVAIVTVLGFFTDVKNTLEYGGIDLRTRVVGARVLIEGMDPYSFKWHPGMSDRLLDPRIDPNKGVPNLTVPPTVLVLHSAIANFSYLNQKIIWLAVQWMAFLSTLGIFMTRSQSWLKRSSILVLGWLILSSYYWRVHVERGQIYIIYVVLLALAWFFSGASFRYHKVISGFLVGFAASLRPPIILMLIPFGIYRQWALLLGSIMGLVSGLSLSLTLANISIWKSYWLALNGLASLKKSYEGSNLISSAGEIGELYPKVIISKLYPKIIEGMGNVDLMSNIPHSNSSFKYLLSRLGMDVSPGNLVLSLCVVIFFLSCFAISLPRRNISVGLVFLMGFIMYLISEFFIPSSRYSYNNVQWLLPLSLIVIEANILEVLTDKFIIFLLFGLLLCVGCFSWIPNFILVSDILIALYVIPTALNVIKRQLSVSVARLGGVGKS
jgi:hypothetical protein